MREHVRLFVATCAKAFHLRGPVYEFGAYQTPGQEESVNLRSIFPGQVYVGCDLRRGPGVDRIEDLSHLSLPDNSAQTIFCLDTLEHVFEARRAVDEMIRVLAPGGTFVVAAPMNFRVHQHPSDYWRLTPGCLQRLLSPLPATVVGLQGVESFPHTVYGIGCKAPVPDAFAAGLSTFVDEFQEGLDLLAARRDPLERIKWMLTGWARGKGERRFYREFYSARFMVQMPVTRELAPPAPHFQGAMAREDSSTRQR